MAGPLGAHQALRNGTNRASNSRSADGGGRGTTRQRLSETGRSAREIDINQSSYVWDYRLYRKPFRNWSLARRAEADGVSWLRLGWRGGDEWQGSRDPESGWQDFSTGARPDDKPGTRRYRDRPHAVGDARRPE